jgi:hypothetical protein
MQKHTLLALFAGLVLLAAPAAAQSVWTLKPGGTTANCSFASAYSTCFTVLDADESSAVLDTRMCENYSVHFNSDTLAETFATTVNVRCSLSPTASDNTSTIVNNATLTGDPSTGLDVLAGYDCPWIYLDVAAHSANDVARASVQCFKRAAK